MPESRDKNRKIVSILRKTPFEVEFFIFKPLHVLSGSGRGQRVENESRLYMPSTAAAEQSTRVSISSGVDGEDIFFMTFHKQSGLAAERKLPTFFFL